MIWVYLFIATVYAACVGLVVRLAAQMLYGQARGELEQMAESYKRIDTEKLEVNFEKKEMEAETDEIFTLYEMTREITKQFDSEQAFRIFKRYLKETVDFEDCQLLNPEAEEIEHLQASKEYFLFNLQSKRRTLGVLAIKNVAEESREKLLILAHQFALTMRRLMLYQEVEQLAITDSLTELHTRRYFMERFDEELRRSNNRGISLSLLMIDVDHFKKCNDEHGHLAGDQVLREVGGIIKDNIREIDIAGRFGGEEFCIILPDTDTEGARFVAERIRAATEKQPIRAYDAVVKVTLSIGVATAPQDSKNRDELISKADEALYRAKDVGRNRIITYSQKKS